MVLKLSGSPRPPRAVLFLSCARLGADIHGLARADVAPEARFAAALGDIVPARHGRSRRGARPGGPLPHPRAPPELARRVQGQRRTPKVAPLRVDLGPREARVVVAGAGVPAALAPMQPAPAAGRVEELGDDPLERHVGLAGAEGGENMRSHKLTE